jgi:hypothetical protein
MELKGIEMCYMLYLGSDAPLPVSKFDTQNPTFYISDKDGNIKHARKYFAKKYIYYVGAHTGCGCGFFYNLSGDGPDDYLITKKSATDLAETIKEALKNSETVELLVSWAGNENKEPQKIYRMTPEQLIADDFPLDEFHFVVFSSS